MVHARPTLPAGHGEVLARPAVAEWTAMLAANRAAAVGWGFVVAGRPVAAVRALARTEALQAGDAFSARLGVPVAAPKDSGAPMVVTGHQPELYHPGVWVKDFLLQRVAREVGGSAIDVVVDSDSFEVLAVSAPCLRPGVERCRQYLAVGGTDTCFACSPVPSAADLEVFCRAGDEMLSTLPAPAIRRHFGAFCDMLRSSAHDAENLAELVTFARRRYEASAGTDYLELPVTALARTEGYAAFVADIALRAPEFAAAYNAELADYRAATKTRSVAQPFPDLLAEHGRVELPLWALAGGARETVWAHGSGTEVVLKAGERTIATLPKDGEGAIAAVRGASAVVAPKALALTLFTRVFVADLFIHGVGGGRYDRVTDGVCRRYFGIEAPGFAVASMTMYLPLGAHVVTEDEVAAAKERLNRLEHNPNQLLEDVEFDSTQEQQRALSLAAEKDALVTAISQPDADKKAVGTRIRQVNAELSELLAPLRDEFAAELEALESQRAASEILTDRTYPFCFWDPQEVADKVR